MHRAGRTAKRRRQRQRLCQSRLAGARKSAHRDEARRRGLQRRVGKIEIGARLGAILLRRRHLGADDGAGADEKRQQRQPLQRRHDFGPGQMVEPGVERTVGMRREAAVDPGAKGEVHQQERQIVKHVDARETVVEFDAVENDRASVDFGDVAEMQVAVAVAHPAGVAPRIHQRMMLFDQFAAGLVYLSHVGGREHRADMGVHVGPVALDDFTKARAAAGIAPDFRRAVKARHVGGEPLDQRQRQASLVGHCRQQTVGLEAPHLDQPVDDLTLFAAKAELAARAAQCHDAKIDFGRRAAVERHFGLAGGAAFLGIGEIQEREAHRPFQLEGALAGQEHMRDMRFDMLDRRDRRQSVAFGPRKEIDRRLVRFAGQTRLKSAQGASAFQRRPGPDARSPPSPEIPP